MTATLTPECNCPVCAASLNAASLLEATGSTDAPEKGDFTICCYCFSILRFDEGLLLRRPSDKELRDLPLELKMPLAEMLTLVATSKGR